MCPQNRQCDNHLIRANYVVKHEKRLSVFWRSIGYTLSRPSLTIGSDNFSGNWRHISGSLVKLSLLRFFTTRAVPGGCSRDIDREAAIPRSGSIHFTSLMTLHHFALKSLHVCSMPSSTVAETTDLSICTGDLTIESCTFGSITLNTNGPRGDDTHP
jgi:hypothetical protein